jgi:hypothetical protein
MENRIRTHQETQDLRGQVSELMEHALNSWRLAQKLRDMLSCLLKEHESGSTDEFRKHKVHNDSQTKDKQSWEQNRLLK